MYWDKTEYKDIKLIARGTEPISMNFDKPKAKSGAVLNRDEMLALDLEVFNAVMDKEWKKKYPDNDKELSTCKHCSRKYVISCICDKAEMAWARILKEVEDNVNDS